MQAAGFENYQIIEDKGSFVVPKSPKEYAEGIWRSSVTSPFVNLEQAGLSLEQEARFKKLVVDQVRLT